MRVKKFEAKSMKEALQMVKHDLGPDAVILAARDNRRAFGLVGEGSVEVTAAVSEGTLHKKRYVESRLKEEDRSKFRESPARMQKNIIEKMTGDRLQAAEAPSVRPLTKTNYIDIADEDTHRESPRAQARQAAEAAPTRAPRYSESEGFAQRVRERESEVSSLKNEIVRLQKALSGLQQAPQNFVSAHPGANYGIGFDLSFMFQKLSESGVSSELAVEILKQAQKELDPLQIKKKPLVDAFVARWFLKNIQVVEAPLRGRVHAFVGASGSGKTSTLVKLASQMVVKERKRIAVVTTDVFKVGAADQLRIYCQILNIPFAVVDRAARWDEVLNRFKNYDMILVDYPSTSLDEIEEIQNLKALLPPAEAKATVHLVMSATTKDEDASELARRFRVTGFQDLIFTGLDQSVQHGVMCNLQRQTGCPLHSFGTGPGIPEDFELATKERVLDLIFRLTRLNRQGE